MSSETTYYTHFVASPSFNSLFFLDSGESVRPVLIFNYEGDGVEKLHEAFRPTGITRGSGPYFSSYYDSPSGLISYLETPNGAKYTTNGFLERNDFHGGQGWSVLSVTKDEMYVSSYHPWSPYPGRGNYFFEYHRITGSRPYPGSIHPQLLGQSKTVYTTVSSKDVAKALHKLYLQEARIALEAPLWTGILQPFVVKTCMPKFIPYKFGERANAEYYSVFNEVLFGRYRNLMAQAYINVAENLPVAYTNTIANVLETASLLHDLGSGVRGFGSLSDAWLGYRYQYSTTKSDITEYANLTARLNKLACMPKIKCFGSASDGSIKCTAQCTFDAAAFIPQNTKEWLATYGLRFSAVNAWDMIPYSFIVDWFAPVGDFLQKLEDADRMYSLQPTDFWVTFTTSYDGVNTYFRCPGEVIRTFPFVTFGGASAKTIGKRCLDTIALFAP